MIDIIWDAIERFIEDWRNSPYEWDNEIDIQAEIFNRLRQAFRDDKKLILEAGYKHIRNRKIQRFSRVCCEPITYYNFSNGKRYYCQPDIVVYDDIGNSDDYPDAVPERNWPILWACEIKYQTEDNYSKPDKEWDREKLVYLLEQNETKFACSLYFNRKDIGEKLIETNGRFRSYTILPKK